MKREFIFTADVLFTINQHAEQEYPSESCGWVIRSNNGQLRYVASANLQDKYHKFDPVSFPRT